MRTTRVERPFQRPASKAKAPARALCELESKAVRNPGAGILRPLGSMKTAPTLGQPGTGLVALLFES
jgi:hypothetical protein